MPITRTGLSTIPLTQAAAPSVNVPIPAAAVAGELAYVALTARQTSAVLLTGPAAAILVTSNLVATVAIDGVWIKRLTAADKTAGFLTFQMADGNSTVWSGGMATYATVDTTNPLHVYAIGNDANANQFNTKPLSTTKADSLVLASFHWSSGTIATALTTNAPLTELWDLQNTSTTARRGCAVGELISVGTLSGVGYSATPPAAYAHRAHVIALALHGAIGDITPPDAPTWPPVGAIQIIEG